MIPDLDAFSEKIYQVITQVLFGRAICWNTDRRGELPGIKGGEVGVHVRLYNKLLLKCNLNSTIYRYLLLFFFGNFTLDEYIQTQLLSLCDVL